MSQLDLGLKSEMMELSEELITKPHSWRKSILMTADLAGFEDKKSADALGIAPEMWSRMKNDPRTGINPDRIEAFMDNCGNELLLHNLAYRRGFRLVERETEMQRLLRLEREKREEVEAENRVLRSLVGGRS